MTELLVNLIDHAVWADAAAVRAIETLPETSAERLQSARLYAHLAAAAHIWLSRIEGATAKHSVWADLPMSEARALAIESLSGLRSVAAQGSGRLQAGVDYRTSGGQPFRNTVAEIITHVALHGCHHRGQIALLARQGGGTPAGTDYITFVRD